MVSKAQKTHGERSELNSVFGLENVDRWNPIRTSTVQSRSRPMRFLVCSTFSRSVWSVVRSASLAKAGTSKKRPSPHLYKVPARSGSTKFANGPRIDRHSSVRKSTGRVSYRVANFLPKITFKMVFRSTSFSIHRISYAESETDHINSMEEIPPWETEVRSVGQTVPHLLWNPQLIAVFSTAYVSTLF
jgi:hypothetical protein